MSKFATAYRILSLWGLILFSAGVGAAESETLPPLQNGVAPASFAEMWSGFDPRAEPLEIEVLHEWQQEDVTLRVVRFRIGVFKGQSARLAAIYGFPTEASRNGKRIPGLLQIHGGGQYADSKACLLNAKRGYATLSIAWAGRISAPDYRVSPAEVRLFWDNQKNHPDYRITTDWGLLDGYHAPGRNAGNSFPSAKAAEWTLDAIESPRNSGWFLCALAARRALTFLEQQSEVDPDRLGVYGHSMGGKLTVMTASDPRVKAAAPSCGGISDRDSSSELFRQTLGDDVSLREISCPIVFLSPANDFHGRIGDLPQAIREIRTDAWRVTCSPHHNHQDTPEYEVATMLWFDEHLKNSFRMPKTPQTQLMLKSDAGIPRIIVQPDESRRVESVDVYYTQHGKADERPEDREDTKHRFWHHAAPQRERDGWAADLPLHGSEKPLWVYANVRYALDTPVTGAGYYYRPYTADNFNLSSMLQVATPTDLQSAGVRAALEPSLLIENFQGDWQKEWFTYRPEEWALSTHKLFDANWRAPLNARLQLKMRSQRPNKLVVLIDDYVAEVELAGDNEWQVVNLAADDLQNVLNEPLSDWSGIRLLRLSPLERLRSRARHADNSRVVGKPWEGPPPEFGELRWLTDQTADQQ